VAGHAVLARLPSLLFALVHCANSLSCLFRAIQNQDCVPFKRQRRPSDEQEEEEQEEEEQEEEEQEEPALAASLLTSLIQGRS